MVKVPFSILPERTAKKVARLFKGLADHMKPFYPYLQLQLRQAEMRINVVDYLALCFSATTMFFLLFTSTIAFILFMAQVERWFAVALVAGVLVGGFVFMQQVFYPKLVGARRIKALEKELLPGLRTMLIQLNAGVPLFDIFSGISTKNYGSLSVEFRIIVKEINGGKSVIEALERSAENNPSEFYRRSIWQLVNGMKTGSNISLVLKEIVDNISEEQVIQIERYGSQLNPLAMFYMLMAVILPSLGMTLLVVLSSFISLPSLMLKLIFLGLFIFSLFFQIMFIGLIKTRRPNLIGG